MKIKKYIIIFFIFLPFISSDIFSPFCIEDENFCSKCNPITFLCSKCINPVLTPDKLGGCEGIQTCVIGKNYCEECNSENSLCKTCFASYYPDENGGCSYTENCKISYFGKCLKCQENYLLIGSQKSLSICKPESSEDFLNCKTIDYSIGLCEECEEKYYLNTGDKRCVETENCYESIYGKCFSCVDGYYLDQKDKNKCKFAEENFVHCKETEDGKTCSKCEDNFFFDSEGKCVMTKFCSQSKNFQCEKCIEGYELTEDELACTNTENCFSGERDTGECLLCKEHFYLDVNNKRKCLSNQEDDDLKFCRFFQEKCKSCENNYYLGEDAKCSSTKNCAESEYGLCKKCLENFYLGMDNKCTNIEHCIYSNFYLDCLECEEGFYFNRTWHRCIEIKTEEFEHCKKTDIYGKKCGECKDNFVLINNDTLSNCKEIKGKGDPLYKCLIAEPNGKECQVCLKGYYLGSNDKKCSKIEHCAIYDNDEEKCKECEEDYCLDRKNGDCKINSYVDEEYGFIYYNCKITNEEGNKCEECQGNYTIGDEGICINNFDCEEEKDGKCLKCKEGNEDGTPYSHCLNKIFGCMDSIYNDHCLRCDGLDFDNCTECHEGYELSKSIDFDGYMQCFLKDEN